jgi:hypothetical protein
VAVSSLIDGKRRSKPMRVFSLSEVVRAGRVAENVGEDGAGLCYRPEQQILGRAVIVEVTWRDGPPGGISGLVEVAPDASGELVVLPANVPNNSVPTGEKFRLPLVPVAGWTHEKDCNCRACQLGFIAAFGVSHADLTGPGREPGARGPLERE